MRLTSLKKMKKYLWIPLELLVLLLPLPASLMLWNIGAQTWQPVSLAQVSSALPVPAVVSADLQGNGQLECLNLKNGTLVITDCHGTALWSSPAGWQVGQAQIGDLNHDGRPEVVLLVWRPFQPWPIDRFLPVGGRIQNFHNRAGLSCHVILIGWVRGGYNEVWAGSALVRPVAQLGIVNMSDAAGQQLAALEGHYDKDEMGGTLTLWHWNGFGFTLTEEVKQNFRQLRIIGDGQQKWVIVQK